VPWRSSPTAIFWLFSLLVITVATNSAGQDIFVTPIPGAPFSAVIEVERKQILPDGATVALKTVRSIGRDSQGRVHNERRTLLPIASTQAPQILSIHLYDPKTRISAVLDPANRTYWTSTLNHPPATVPPTVRFGLPPGDTLPHNDFTADEDLGVRDMEGLPAHGVRKTQTVPDESGTNKDLVVTDEYWYSDELRINLLIKHIDPRTGTVTMKVSRVTRSDPDPAFFEIPEGYKLARK